MDLLSPQPGLLFFMSLSICLWLIGLFFLARVVWKRNDLSENAKTLWTLFFIFIPSLAFIGYFVFGKKDVTA
jgi:FtsH-binding integral membrane protein